jgi:hypothetical protein
MVGIPKGALGRTAVAATIFVLCSQAVAASTIQIRVLNAKNGERVQNQKVSVAIKGVKDASEYTTNAEGNINVELDAGAEVFVATEWWTTCRKTGGGIDPYVSVSRVLQEGVTVENNCGRAKSETVKGKLIIFAEKTSLVKLFQK